MGTYIHFTEEQKESASLKLRIMSELTEKYGDKPASLYWKETVYRSHEEKMLNMLKEACGIE